MSNKDIGIKEVAVAAGVSVTTVSHVLNDVSYPRISPETKGKVKSAAAQLGYGPNRLAQALRTQRTGMLGLVSEDIATTPYAGRIILGADEAARARSYNLLQRPDGHGRLPGRGGAGAVQTWPSWRARHPTILDCPVVQPSSPTIPPPEC